MSDKYVRPSIGGWLAPLLVAPWVSTYAAVTFYAFVLGPDGQLTRWAFWVAGMALGTLFAAVYVMTLALVDVLLLAVRSRVLPTGRAAWLMGLVAPAVPLVVYGALKPWTLYKLGPWAILGAVAIPIVCSAFGARIFFGQKTQLGRGR